MPSPGDLLDDAAPAWRRNAIAVLALTMMFVLGGYLGWCYGAPNDAPPTIVVDGGSADVAP